MKLFLFCLLLIWATITLTSCQTAPQPTLPVVPVEVFQPPVQYTGLWPKPEYTAELVVALNTFGKDLWSYTPKDAQEWCFDKYKNKKQFYVNLISAMSKYESNWNPNTEYKESFSDAKGNKVISVGLLQVSSESCAGYGMKYIPSAELKKNSNNFECTVRVLSRWIPRNGVIAQGNLGGAKYWSVLREGPTHKREAIKKLVCGAAK